jgi:DNA-binding PucR family transcriptional regulator
MRKITEVSDYSPMEPRELFVLNIALSIGRLGERH